jgi:hypothetical protein
VTDDLVDFIDRRELPRAKEKGRRFGERMHVAGDANSHLIKDRYGGICTSTSLDKGTSETSEESRPSKLDRKMANRANDEQSRRVTQKWCGVWGPAQRSFRSTTMSTSANFLSNSKLALQLLEKAAEAIPEPAKGPIKAIAGGLVALINLREVSGRLSSFHIRVDPMSI